MNNKFNKLMVRHKLLASVIVSIIVNASMLYIGFLTSSMDMITGVFSGILPIGIFLLVFSMLMVKGWGDNGTDGVGTC